MDPKYFVQAIFLLAGSISLLAALLDWDWFFHSRNARFLMQSLGRKRSRIIYGVIGGVCLVMAALLWFQE